MKILFINSVDVGGGAAAATRRLFVKATEQGIDGIFVVGRKQGTDPRVVPIHSGSLPDRIANKLTTWAEERSGLQYFFRPDIRWFERRGLLDGAALAHVHNPHGEYLHHDFVFQLSRRIPVIWSLHDEWAYTGHCAYTLDCERWRTGCGNCPYLRTYPGIHRDTTGKLWLRKRRNAENTEGRLRLVLPCKWLESRVKASLLSRVPVSVIPYGIDTTIFRPVDGNQARKRLGLPEDRRIVLFAAHGWRTNPFKGFPHLVEALKRLQRDSLPPFLVAVGDDGGIDFAGMGIDGISRGAVRSESAMAEYYGAADVFILPSLADNSPFVMLESMACGTPVAAFAVGGIPEAVREGKTGALAPPRESGALADAVRRIIDRPPQERERMRRACTEAISGTEHDFESHTAAVFRLYREVAGAGNP